VRSLRVLHVVGTFPSAEDPTRLVFVKSQVESLVEIGVECDVLVLSGRGLSKYLRRSRVRDRLRQWPADLVHAHYSYTAIPCFGHGIPVIVSFLGSDLYGAARTGVAQRIDGAVHRLVARAVAGRAAHSIVKSPAMQRRLGLPAEVIPNGVDLQRFHPASPDEMLALRQRLGLDPRRRYALFAANPANRIKRHELARQAVERASRAGEPVDLLTMHDAPQVRLADTMRACDLLILTSAHEGSPNVVKEAMACNLPVVSVDVGDVRTRLEETQAGLVVDEATPEALAAAIVTTLQRGRTDDGRRLVQELGLETVARRIRAIYDQTVARSDSALRSPSTT
jgi:glycosyltransferase involved in cell wall biosynthesis